MNSQRSKRQWGRLETRVAFWKKCHEQLKSDSTEAESAHRFFRTQVELDGCPESEELLDVQERCLLLCLAAHWLSQLSPEPVEQLESLEKKLWLLRVRRHVLAIEMEAASVFELPPPPMAPGWNMYEALMKEFSMANVSCLNTDACLRLEGLPGPSDEPSAGPEERSVLTALIGQVLDQGSVHEASRACRYFSLYHRDLWLALRCRGLASGELRPEEAPEAPPGKSIKPCKRRLTTPLPAGRRENKSGWYPLTGCFSRLLQPPRSAACCPSPRSSCPTTKSSPSCSSWWISVAMETTTANGSSASTSSPR